MLASVTERDVAALGPGVEPARGAELLTPLAEALGCAGLRVRSCRSATVADVADLGSTWAKRLGIPSRRTAWLLEAVRLPGPSPTGLLAGAR